MTGLDTLWIPILASAVIVFAASSIIHMAPLWHRNEFPAVPGEDGVMAALRPFQIPPGDYMVPRAASMKEMEAPAFIEKTTNGPVMVLTVLPNGVLTMGKSLALWFVYVLIVSVLAAYVVGTAAAPGTPYMQIFRLTSVTAFIGYAAALWQMSIWYGRAWSITLTATLDGLIYALLTGGVFGWLWPG